MLHINSQAIAKLWSRAIVNICDVLLRPAATMIGVIFVVPVFAQTVTLTTSGSYTVPANVYQISVVVRGAGGGAGGPDLNSSGNGGSGAAVTALINVTPGQVFNANVGRGGQPGRWWGSGGNGFTPSGGAGGLGWANGGSGGSAGPTYYSGGGGGGGGATSFSLGATLYMAAGGGGGGGGANATGSGVTGQNGGASAALGAAAAGGVAASYTGDGSGGSGGGGGCTTGGAASPPVDDSISPSIAAGAGRSCAISTATVSAVTYSSAGGSGGTGVPGGYDPSNPTQAYNSQTPGSNGSVSITCCAYY
ncbi:MAG: hypothetical protein IPN04_11610 [Rhodoferax sp.]|nr:hypothetical protein [Rhodoferax sp.]